MSQNDQDRDQQEQGEGYQDPNEQETLESRSESMGSEPPITETTTVQVESSDDDDDLDDLDDLDELDEDRDDDQRESGPNRRFNIG
jgi:hypothetical protein